jgi:anti-sigma factor RsiW
MILVSVLIGGGAVALTNDRAEATPSVAHEVLASHLRSLMPNHLTDVASTDNHNVKPWFNGRVGVSPTVPRLEAQGFPLIGGRVDYLAGRPVAAVVYGRRQHMINVFTFAGPGEAGPTERSDGGFHLVRWQHAGSEIWVASDLNWEELRQFVSLIRGSEAR